MRLRAVAAAATLLLVLAAAAAVGAYLSRRGDWPGWDEGWALVLLPVGVPAAVAAGLLMAGRGALTLRATVLVSLAIWAWGALLFFLWLTVDV